MTFKPVTMFFQLISAYYVSILLPPLLNLHMHFLIFFFYEAPCPGKEYFFSVICGVVAVALVSLLLVGIVTYTVTKRTVQRKLLKSLSQPSDASPDSCEVDPVFFFLQFFIAKCLSAVNKT